jgi:tetratricopeptide (TPR) repeat protein
MAPTLHVSPPLRLEFHGPGPRAVWPPPRRAFPFGVSAFFRPSTLGLRASSLLFALLLASCSGNPETPAQRADAAKALFERATKEFHLPSADAKGPAQRQLQDQAAAAYEQLLKKYSDQAEWAAPALRSLGNIRAAQTNLDAAVKLYASVATRYPKQDWEILMAWKSAADQLWDAGRHDDAKAFYQKIVTRFDKPDATSIVKTAVRGSKDRLTNKAG